MIKTTCRECIFRLNDDDGNQNGCYLGKLEKYIDKNNTDKENDYYVINGLCNTCRNSPKFSDLDDDAKFAQENNTTEFYIFFDCLDTNTIPTESIEELKLSNYKNITAHFVFDNIKFTDTYKRIKELVDGKFSFKISKLTSKEVLNELVYSCISNLEKRCFIGFSDGVNNIDYSVFKKIEEKINKDLDSLVCYVDESMVMVYNNILSLFFKEEKELDLDKIVSQVLFIAQKQNLGDLVWIKESV